MKIRQVLSFFSCIVVLVFCATTAYSQTKIETTSGQIYEGRIIADSADFILIKTQDSSDIKIQRAQVASVRYNVLPINNGKSAFPILGGALGTPAGIQLVAGYYFDDLGVRASFGYLGLVYGGQVNFLRNLSHNEHFSHNVSLGVGYSLLKGATRDYYSDNVVYSSRPLHEWTYVGAFYDFNWGGFFGEVGLSIGAGTYSNPQFMVQLGYVHEFRY